VDERGTHARARQAQRLTAVRRAVVEVERVGRPVFAHGLDHQSKHIHFALGVMGSERQDVATGVVEDPMNAHGLALAVNYQGCGVTDVCMP